MSMPWRRKAGTMSKARSRGRALGIVAGVRWHEAIARTLGLADHQHAEHAAKPGPKQLWTCSMHPQVIREEPGLCPICHMELVPLNSGPGAGEQAGIIAIDPTI